MNAQEQRQTDLETIRNDEALSAVFKDALLRLLGAGDVPLHDQETAEAARQKRKAKLDKLL